MGTPSKILSLFLLFLSLSAFAVAPKLVLTNQYGETSINTVGSGTTYIAPAIAANSFVANLTAGSAQPAATSVATVQTKLVMTGFTAGAGVVAGTDTLLQGEQKLAGNITNNTTSISALQNGQFTPQTETISAAGAISVSIMESILSNGGGSTYAATLAAPSSQDGQIKILKMGVATHTVTVPMTNIVTSGAYTAAGTTTLTFTSAGDSAVLMAVGSQWVYLGGSAVAS